MVVALALPDGYGYPVLVALGLIPILSLVQGTYVGIYRGKAGVKYPNAYASDAQAKENKAAYKFNCAQRAHANLLENMSQVMLFILIAGVQYPMASAWSGLFWVVTRGMYAYGYITSDKPDGRGRYMAGSTHYIAQLALMGMVVATALKML